MDKRIYALCLLCLAVPYTSQSTAFILIGCYFMMLMVWGEQ